MPRHAAPASVSLDWVGASPPSALSAALAERGIRLHQWRGPGDTPCVVATASSRRPRPPSGHPWIWACAGELSDSVVNEAVLDGAYDVVPLGAADAAERLAIRIR